MNKVYKTILLISLIVLGTGILTVNSTYAQPADPLAVEFEKTPLFKEANFLPGEGITRWIKVTNNSGESRGIAIETINESDPDNFASQLNLTIKEGATILYNNTLINFFNAGQFYLSDLANGATKQYDLTIAFDSASNNDYQGKALGFDILIGFQGEEGQDGDGNGITEGGGGGGGGGGTLPQGLTILSESVASTNLTGCESCSITINWTTNYFSTSRVVYSKASESHNFDLYALNYGYANSKEGDNSLLEKVTAHSVTITGLSPNTTYYFRCESHASPSSITGEFNFTTVTAENCANQNTGGNQEEGGNPPAGGSETPGQQIALGGETGGNQGPVPSEVEGGEGNELTAGNGGQGEEEGQEGLGNQANEGLRAFLSGGLASLIDVLGKFGNNWLIILLLIIILFLLFLLFKRRKKEEK
ncbi:MAG: fibronectin type III domain-containing protein [Candidatus Nealsonbacteria bacterium]|nr:fibronectin type III domain-containing protein [Candidatus Nealsonbacteria bacterium]